jgi:tetratricopeptide (TPR) repeat protein
MSLTPACEVYLGNMGSNVQVYFAAALLNRGVSYQNINLYSNSISDFNKSIALCSQFTNSYAYDISLVLIKDWFCLANSLALDDRPQSAIDDYNISLDLLNKLASDGHRELADLAASIYTQLGTTYFQIQNTGEALNNFNKACII